MTVEEAVQYCQEKCLTVAFGDNGVLVKDEGIFGTSFWDTEFVGAVEQMKEYLED